MDLDPVHECFFGHNIEAIPNLLENGSPSAFPRTFEFGSYFTLREILLHEVLRQLIGDVRRAFFLIQLYYDYIYHRNSPEGLCWIWRCLNDPFLSCTEISILGSLLPRQQIASEDLLEYYQDRIIDRLCSDKPSPRSLMSMCRVEIRRLLSLNQQLPAGIYNFGLPKSTNRYLNLEL